MDLSVTLPVTWPVTSDCTFADNSLAMQVAAILRKYGTDAHVYLPGIGAINGLTAGNYLDSAGTTPATVDNPVGKVDDAAGAIDATQATTANKPILRRGAVNLLTYSEQFDNAAWTKGNVTITANAIAAPDGTLTADKLIETAVSAAHQVNRLPGLGVNTYTYTIYAKAAERNTIQIEQESGGNSRFVLSGAGTATALGANTVSIEALADGWYRLRTTFMATGAFGIYTSIYNGSTIYLGDITKGLYLWGAKLEVGASPTTYNSTTVKNLLGYSELFDNAAWTKSNSFVQTNLLTYSEAFDNAAWTKSNTTVVENTTIAPNGYQTADKIVEDSASSAHAIKQTIITVIGNTYTLSFYAKAAEKSLIQFYAGGSDITGNPKANFDLANGALGTVDAGITASISLVSNDYYRCTLTFTAASTSFDILIGGITSTTSSRGEVYLGTLGAGFYLWGAQLVQGSVAGNYRRTDAASLPCYYPNHNGVVCAEKLVESATTADHYIQQSATAGNVPYTYSCYLKSGERTNALVAMSDLASGNATAIVNLSTGAVTSTISGSWTNPTAQAVPVGNGYYRVSITATKGAGTSIGARTHIYTTASSYAGDGTSGIYIFGAQLSDSASLDPYVLNAAAAPTAPASSSTGNYWWQFDSTDLLTATFPAGYESATIINTAETGQVTYTAQNIVGNYDIRGAEIGSELVTNGGFDTDTGWNKGAGVTITGGVAVFNAVASGAGLTQAAAGITSGKVYKVTVTISGYVSGTFATRLTSGSFITLGSSNGTFSAYVVAGGNTIQIYSTVAVGTFNVDNVNVRELTPKEYARFIFRTGLTASELTTMQTFANRLAGV